MIQPRLHPQFQLPPTCGFTWCSPQWPRRPRGSAPPPPSSPPPTSPLSPWLWNDGPPPAGGRRRFRPGHVEPPGWCPRCQRHRFPLGTTPKNQTVTSMVDINAEYKMSMFDHVWWSNWSNHVLFFGFNKAKQWTSMHLFSKFFLGPFMSIVEVPASWWNSAAPPAAQFLWTRSSSGRAAWRHHIATSDAWQCWLGDSVDIDLQYLQNKSIKVLQIIKSIRHHPKIRWTVCSNGTLKR